MIIFFLLLGLIVVLFWLWQNKMIDITYDHYHSDKLDNAFDGFKIALISDFHNACYGKDQHFVLNKIRQTDADVLFVVGDMIDRYRSKNIERALCFMRGLTDIAPVYYVPGNHEARMDDYKSFVQHLTEYGVTVLNDEVVTLKHADAAIDIIGINDPLFYATIYAAMPQYYDKKLADLKKEMIGNVSFLLIHRPEFLDVYTRNQIDLVFAGHAHGGQIRLPGLGGLYAPHQGFLPKYTDGLYTEEDTTMLVSRGLGNSGYALMRLFNRPHLAVLTLCCDDDKEK
jgi:hypothetical protein